MYHLGRCIFRLREYLLVNDAVSINNYLYLLNVASLYSGHGRAIDQEVEFCGNYGFRVLGYNSCLKSYDKSDCWFYPDYTYSSGNKDDSRCFLSLIDSTIDIFRAAAIPDICEWVKHNDPLWQKLAKVTDEPIRIAPEWILDLKFNPAIALLSYEK